MTRRRLVILSLAVGVLLLQGALRGRLQAEQERSKLVIAAADQRGMAADVAVPVLALGAFRGIVVDYLWLRSIALQDRGRTYEARQLAEQICRLQPRLPAVWSYLASHLAYDLAATDQTPRGRYRWVMNGIELLRDRGLRYNPDAPQLCYTLARIYQDKLGSTMDPFNKQMKQFLALDMAFFFGPRSVRELAQSPSAAALVAQDPQVGALAEEMRQALGGIELEGLTFRLLTVEYQLWRGKADQLAPDLQALLRYRDAPGYPRLLRAARRSEFSTRSGFRLERMVEIDRAWGPTDGSGLDWHSAETQSLYWAVEGTRIATEQKLDREYRRCRQTAVLALKNAMRRGRVKFLRDGSTYTAPMPQLVDRLERIYRESIVRARRMAERTRADPSASAKQVLQANAHLNNQITARADFLGEAITLLAEYGRETDGRRLLKIAHTAYPKNPAFAVPYENFLLHELAQRYSNAGLYDTQAGMSQLLEGTWTRAFVLLALGEDDRYRTYERLAKASQKRWNAYLAKQAKEEPGVYERLGINYRALQRRALGKAMNRLPASVRGMLAERVGLTPAPPGRSR